MDAVANRFTFVCEDHPCPDPLGASEKQKPQVGLRVSGLEFRVFDPIPLFGLLIHSSEPLKGTTFWILAGVWGLGFLG